jgi:hypothetical protein
VNVWVELGAVDETRVKELDVKEVFVVFGVIQVVSVVNVLFLQIPNFAGAVSGATNQKIVV